MSCTKNLTISIAQTGDLGMDAAVYESGTQKIFGVRGQWLFQFNAATGALEASMRFTNSAMSTSDICTLGGKLYICSWYLPNQLYTSFPLTPLGDVFVVTANTFTLSSQWNLTTALGFGFRTNFGYFKIAASTTLIATINRDTTVWALNSLFSTDPTNIAGTTHFNTGGYNYDIAYDSHNNAFWIANSLDIYATTVDVSVNDCFDNGGIPVAPTGICYNLAQNKVYAVQGSNFILKVNAVDALPAFTNFPVTQFDTGIINAKPCRIKSVNNFPSNPLNGKVIIPCWSDGSGPGGSDTVVVWNPATDSVSALKTGFTAPIDVVSTPTKNWAIQTGTSGLKEIV